MAGQHEALEAPRPHPDLQLPASTSTVEVCLIDTTTYGETSTGLVFTPTLPGHHKFEFPSYAFLISNTAQDKHVLFDLGMRKDWESTLPPNTVAFVKQHMPFQVQRNINEILDEDPGDLGVTTKSISSVIWSHHHFDHRGDLDSFLPATELIVGPGFKKTYLPGYPANPESSILESEVRGRSIRELDVDEFQLRLGGFPAYDVFGDGSFFLLSSPGHTVGHLSALARVTSTPNPTFVFMGGDCAHYPAIFRPTKYLPLPREVPAVPGSRFGVAPCPGAWLQEYVHPTRSCVAPFVKANQGVNVDPDQAERSISAMQEFDAAENVLVCIAHDASLLGNVDFYPKTLNGWKERGWKEAVRWAFCGDFDVREAKRDVGMS